MMRLWFRALTFLGLWLVISGFSISDLVLGLAVAVIAAFTSVRLLPGAGVRLSLRGCVELILRLPLQIGIAGADIARRALTPDLPLRPGFVEYTSHLPDGVPRRVFAIVISMQPGSAPIAGHRSGDFIIHCIDDTLPVSAGLRADESRLSRAFGLDRADG
jgi:multicomponent Na+:H+ antiporter subunit E